ncbi:MAG TPA: protein kinase, partial [Gemmatimonadaceae bacterium]|nr:protein kinase [Gemmatimonadaceae bacterium]
MPYVEGESLRSRLGRDGALPIGDVTGIVRDVARALAYAHERGVVHRDIKPDNVLLSGGTAVVTDFGIAKAISAAREPSASSTLTQLGTSLGTPAYMAPEQAAGDPEIDHRADIYALGCTAYELLAGHSPFSARSPQRMLAAHLTEQPRHIAEVRAGTPAPLAELVMRCLAKDPAERPQSASEVVHALEGVAPSGAHAALSVATLGGPHALGKALLLYAVSFIAVAAIARMAVMAIGLPDWVFVGALVVMALGLPVIALTGYAHHAAHRLSAGTPVLTPGGSPGALGIAALAARAGPRVTWRRVALGGAMVLGAFAILVGAFMLARSLGIGPAGSLLAAGKLTGDDRVLVADFRVNGADSSIGHIASEAVRIELAQSEAVAVVPANAVAAALQRMRRPPTTRVDATLAREIATREGIKAILNGDITPFGGGFVVTMRLVAAQSGEELAAYRETADSPRDLIPTLEALSRRLRGKIGESLKSVRATPALLDVTTSSLEALRKYAMATRVMDLERKYPEAITLLEEAVSLDTSFAMAYRKLGVAYRSYGPQEKGDSALARAFRHRDRLTDQERLLTVATYYGMGPGRDRQKGIAAYEELLALNPQHSGALNNIGLLYRQRREFDKAEDVYRRAVATDEASIAAFTNLRVTLFEQGKIAAAESVTAEQRRRFPGVWSEPFDALPLLYHRGQLDSIGTLLRGLITSSNPAVRNTALSVMVEYETL